MLEIDPHVLRDVPGGAKAKPIHVSAGQIEAFSTGDADLLNSRMMQRLYNEKEKLTASRARSVVVPVIITKP
jgi:hypothetical protein